MSWFWFRTDSDLRSRCIIKKVIECSQQGVDALSPSHFLLLALFVFLSHTLNHTHHGVISTNLEEVEELNARNYTSIQTYVSQSQMPSMCEIGVTLLEVSLFVKCAPQYFGYHPHWSQWLLYTSSDHLKQGFCMPSILYVRLCFQKSLFDTRYETNPSSLGESCGQYSSTVDEVLAGFYLHLMHSSVVFWQEINDYCCVAQSSRHCPLQSCFKAWLKNAIPSVFYEVPDSTVSGIHSLKSQRVWAKLQLLCLKVRSLPFLYILSMSLIQLIYTQEALSIVHGKI